MRKLLCYLLANWLVLFPGLASAGQAAGSEMVEYEPPLAAPALEKSASKEKQGRHTFFRDGLGRVTDVQSDGGDFHLQLIYPNLRAVLPTRALYNGHDISLPLSVMPTKFYGGMEYEQYVQFMQDWVEQDQFRYIGCPACTDTGSTGNVGDVAWYALVGFLMITGLGTVYGAVVAALSGA